ncbi:pterin-4-alpha-carbinolamine dehydratase 2, mitochondrial-like isoform X4 [Triticum urartu]|uniref:pterin-4-alpha-carbinolamine dehydratase 2, mitochondrial-like isoform X4 n=1 Tax=Triticum urartu TaxID=4572 RepID=UPI0020434B0E|nr:pterin-4-alpha-carbinolamine dehydratase 2, mitochondrial-like isoform X4 [Triticum urartu]
MEERTLFRGQAPGEAAPARPSASQAVGDEAAAKVGEPSQPCSFLNLSRSRIHVLSKKSCLPCSSKDLQAMSEDSAKRAWKVKKFAKGLDFFQLVAAVAEEQGHHPDLHLVGWNNVKIDVWTHAVRGITDFILAAKINELES